MDGGKCSTIIMIQKFLTPLNLFTMYHIPGSPIALSKESIQKALKWVTGDDTGLSSITIWKIMMTGEMEDEPRAPADPSDFGRCYRLLKLIPEFENSLPFLHGYDWRNTQLSVFVNHYQEMCDLFEQGKNEELYKLMKNLGF